MGGQGCVKVQLIRHQYTKTPRLTKLTLCLSGFVEFKKEFV